MNKNKLIIIISIVAVLTISIIMEIVQSHDIDSQIRINQNIYNDQRLIDIYKNKIKETPCDQDLHYNLLQAYFLKNNVNANLAKEFYEDFGKNNECKEIYYYAKGFIDRELNNFESAKNNFISASSQKNPYKGSFNSLGYLYEHNLNDINIAINYYKLSADTFPDLEKGLSNLIDLYFTQKNLTEISKLINDEKYKSKISNYLKLKYYKETGNYIKYLYYHLLSFLDYTSILSIIAALILMVFWSILILKFDYRKISLWKCALSFFFGIVAILTTTLLQAITPEVTAEIPFFHYLILFFVKVGPIEEISKILPVILMIYLLNLKDKPSEIVIYGSLVALGFATIENMQYLSMYGFNLIFSRFVFSVLLHITLTGIFSFALYQYYNLSIKLSRLIKIFLLIAFSHGAYNFILSAMQFSMNAGIFQLLVYATYGLVALLIKYYICSVIYCINSYNNENRTLSHLSNIYLLSVIISWSMAFILTTYNIGIVNTVASSFFHIVFSVWVISYTYNIFGHEVKDTPASLIRQLNLKIAKPE